MKYLALGYDGNDEVTREVEAGSPTNAVLRIKDEKLFGPEGSVNWLVEQPALVHNISPDGDITSWGSSNGVQG